MQAAVHANFHYRVHGIRVVANVPMPALMPGLASDYPDLRIWLGSMDALRMRRPDVDFADQVSRVGVMLWRQSTPQGQVVVQRVTDSNLALIAILSAAGDIVEVGWQSSSNRSPDDLERIIANYFSNAWLGMALRLAGHLVLHGNAVCVNGGALAWLGDKGAGKSTLTAAFVAAGYPLLTDDQIVIWAQADKVWIAPGIMRLHLWPESLPVMGPSKEYYHFEQPFDAFPKGYMTVTPPAAPPSPNPLTPLRAIYILQPRHLGLAAPVIETPSAGVGFDMLYSHCFARPGLSLTADALRVEFQAVGELYRRVSVRRLTLPNDLTCLTGVVQRLAEDAAV